jgi:hypothetical protein
MSQCLKYDHNDDAYGNLNLNLPVQLQVGILNYLFIFSLGISRRTGRICPVKGQRVFARYGSWFGIARGETVRALWVVLVVVG